MYVVSCQDPKEVIKAAVRQYPILKEAKGYEFAYKIAVSFFKSSFAGPRLVCLPRTCNKPCASRILPKALL